MKTDIHHRLCDLYAEWRRLTDIEGTAIGNEEWSRVEQQQRLKRELQNQIMQTADQWLSEQGETEAACAKYEREFRPIVSNLIQRESQNHELLCERRKHLQSRLNSLKQTGTRLRGIQRTYASAGSSNWQSYS
jgi:hypothetical protein